MYTVEASYNVAWQRSINSELEQRSINCCLATVSWSKGLSTVAWQQWVGNSEHHKIAFFSASAFFTPQFELNALTLLYNFSQPCYCEVIVPSVKSLPVSLCASSSAPFLSASKAAGYEADLEPISMRILKLILQLHFSINEPHDICWDFYYLYHGWSTIINSVAG